MTKSNRDGKYTDFISRFFNGFWRILTNSRWFLFKKTEISHSSCITYDHHSDANISDLCVLGMRPLYEGHLYCEINLSIFWSIEFSIAWDEVHLKATVHLLSFLIEYIDNAPNNKLNWKQFLDMVIKEIVWWISMTIKCHKSPISYDFCS